MSQKGKIIIAGGTGYLGAACADRLSAAGYNIVVLSRSQGGSNYPIVRWDPASGFLEDENILEGSEALINLTGVPLNSSRWSDSFKEVLRDSRIKPAEFLKQRLSRTQNPPKVYIGQSAIGIYGDSGQAPVTENYDVRPESFAEKLGIDWENAHFSGSDATRSVTLRTGIIVANDSEFIKQLKLPATFGFFPYIGDGSQVQSWIHLHDFTKAVQWIIETPTAKGTFNVTAPDAQTFKDFMQTMRRVKGIQGFVFGAPVPLVSLVLGEMTELLLACCNAVPEKLIEAGFEFEYGSLESALEKSI